jgi:SAM-dependent methyltransferase
MSVTTVSEPTAPALPPHAVMARMMSGYAVSQMIYAAARLRIADLLDAGPQTIDDLSSGIGVNRDALARVMRGLTVVGVVAVDDDGRFRGTTLSRLLLSGAPGSMHSLALLTDQSYRVWGEILATIETGAPAFDRCFGMSRFEYLRQHADQATAFTRAMSGMLQQNAAVVVAAFDFSRCRRIVDVGGGLGVLISAILAANPDARGVLFETAAVAEEAKRSIASGDLAERCDVVAGDFFESAPAGGDAYVLSQTIHNWNDSQAVQILRTCRSAMAPDGTVLVIEMLMPPRLDGSPMEYPLVMTDLQMMLMTGGKERTEAEHRLLLESAGLRLRNVIRTRGPLAILEAVGD